MDLMEQVQQRPFYEEIEREKKHMFYERKLVECCQKIDQAYVNLEISDELLKRRGKLEAELTLRGLIRYIRLRLNPAKVVFREYCARYELGKIELLLNEKLNLKQLTAPGSE